MYIQHVALHSQNVKNQKTILHILLCTTTRTDPFRFDMEITFYPLRPYREIRECGQKRTGWAVLGGVTRPAAVVLCSATPPWIFCTAVSRERRPVIGEVAHWDTHDLPPGLVLELERSFK